MYKKMKTRNVILNNKKVILDEDIADDIIKLNNKGYETLYCCAGHIQKCGSHKGFSHFYAVINIKDISDINRLMECMGKHLKVELCRQLDFKNLKKKKGFVIPDIKDNTLFIIRPDYRYILANDRKGEKRN